MDSSLLGIKTSTSTSLFMPRPLQSGQKPNGALNENNLGSTFGTEKPHIGHVCLSDNNFSPLSVRIINKPCDQSNAVSIDSKIRVLFSFLTIILSTMMSMLCLLFLSKSLTSSIVVNSPSTRKREKPLIRILSKISFCVPFSSWMTGANN